MEDIAEILRLTVPIGPIELAELIKPDLVVQIPKQSINWKGIAIGSCALLIAGVIYYIWENRGGAAQEDKNQA